MRGMHGRHAGSGEAATIEDVIHGRPAREHLKTLSFGEFGRNVAQESSGIAHRLSKEQQGSGRLGRVKD